MGERCTSRNGLSSAQAERVHGFLEGFLPRLKKQAGVKETLHSVSPDGRDVTTVIVWETSNDAKRYRKSELIRDPITLEAELGFDATRAGFALTQHLR